MMPSNPTILAPLFKAEKTLDQILFSPLDAFDEGYIQVSDLHSLWYAQYGNPEGVPILVVHGGPGAGCSADSSRYFDPQYYRIILVDQRGALRSKPFGEMEENTTPHLVADFEKVRQSLGIETWVLFGYSWGSILSMAYGQAHPEVMLGFLLGGVTLGTAKDNHYLWYGIRDHYPEAWEEFAAFLPEAERGDLRAAYYKRLMDPDPAIHLPAARAFMKYDFTAATLLENPLLLDLLHDDALVLGCCRAFAHYAFHNFFLEAPLLEGLPAISHLPALIVQGRHDLLTKPHGAYDVHRNWPGSKLSFVPDGSHSRFDPSITQAIIMAGEEMKGVL